MLATVPGQSQNKTRDTLYIEISCGFGAQTSKAIQSFKTIVDLNDTAAIQNKLFADSKLEQVLAAITLKYYKRLSPLRLTDSQEKKLQEISKFKDKFSLCFTCTFQQQGTVKELFNRKEYVGSYSVIESFLSNRL
jgi:hypothetical protein